MSSFFPTFFIIATSSTSTSTSLVRIVPYNGANADNLLFSPPHSFFIFHPSFESSILPTPIPTLRATSPASTTQTRLDGWHLRATHHSHLLCPCVVTSSTRDLYAPRLGLGYNVRPLTWVMVVVLAVLVPGCCLLWYVYSNNTPMHNTRTSVCPSATASLRRPFDPDASFESNKKNLIIQTYRRISSLSPRIMDGLLSSSLSFSVQHVPFLSTHAHARFSNSIHSPILALFFLMGLGYITATNWA